MGWGWGRPRKLGGAFHVKREPEGNGGIGGPSGAADLAGQARALGVALEAWQVELLAAFEEQLGRRAVPLGLVARSDLPRLRERHVLDSLRAAAVVGPRDRTAYDLGSGAGLPGIPVAVARPALRVGLVEPRARRAAFLEAVTEELGLANVRVLLARAEELREPVDLCFARGLAPAARSFALARPLLLAGGRLVYFAGRSGGIPRSVPGATMEVLEPHGLESAGPLVMMGRQ